MTNILGCCKHCGNPMPGLVYETYKKELDKLINTSKTIMSYQPVFTDKGVRELTDSLGIIKDCCRISLMSYYNS